MYERMICPFKLLWRAHSWWRGRECLARMNVSPCLFGGAVYFAEVRMVSRINWQDGLILAIEASITCSDCDRAELVALPIMRRVLSLRICPNGRRPSSVGSQTGDVPLLGAVGSPPAGRIYPGKIIPEPENQSLESYRPHRGVVDGG